MARNLGPVRAALAAAGLLLACPAPASDPETCPPQKPILSGPAVVNRYEGYAITWTNVLGESETSQPNVFVVERSEDPTFASKVERFQTTRTSSSWGAPGGSPRTLYHRVGVQSYCAGPTAVRVDSAVLPVNVTDECKTPLELAAPTVSPAEPPAFTTYIVSWDTLGIGQPGPGGGADGLRFRLRRTSGTEVSETVNETGAAAFSDGPGEYLYEVRTENVCGHASAWSPAARVVVGTTKTSALVLVSTPRPILVPAGAGVLPSTSFAIRNAGSEALDVLATGADASLAVSPASFLLESGEIRSLGVSVGVSLSPETPLHSFVELLSKNVHLRVPIDAGAAASGADQPVGWDDEAADVDRAGNALVRHLVNQGSTTAAIVSSISTDWVVVSSRDGKAWDRPLAPHETRAVTIGVDRTRRRAAIGTEVGTVSIETAGHPGEAKSLSVADDGPPVATTAGSTPGSGLPPLYAMKSRLLFPSLPNALDVLGVGRYTSDIWLSNVDALAPIQVVMTLIPSGQAITSSAVRQFLFTLGPGETHRFRNVVGTVFGFEGACSLDISSPAATLSATAMVNNKPVTPLVAGKTAALGTAVTGTLLSNAEFGFEMRPVAAGEGARALDPTYVVSGLWHDSGRRTNLILRETTGYQTVVRVQLFGQAGDPVLRNGKPVDVEVTVPALGSLQVNDADLFPADAVPGSVWARVEFRQGVIDGFGRNRGAVVPFATVIDSGTQDASLRVGVSATALAPATLSASSSIRALDAALPFGGGAEPLLFPAAHVTGAALASGASPKWRTRVTFSNVSDTEQRSVRLIFEDKSGKLPGGTSASSTVVLPPRATASVQDVLEDAFLVPRDAGVWGTVRIDNVANEGTAGWKYTWTDVDVQTETYTPDTENPSLGEFRTGMEGYSYRHGYSSFQSNLGTVLIDGAETSPRNRTNLILEEVGGASCTLAVAVYRPGALVPIAMTSVALAPFEYVSRELFHDLMKLDLGEVVDARVVVRQIDGDGVFMAFVSKINLVTGDPANVFLRPASAGTGR